jgi:sensor c-di-GMP phosphodiesterase-like protein
MGRLATISTSIAIACMATLAPVLTSVYVANRDAVRREHNDLKAFAAKALIRAELVTYQAIGAISDIDRIPGDACTPAYLDELRRISFDYRYIQDAGVYAQGKYVCSALLGDARVRHLALPPADWQSQDGYQFWFHQKNPLDTPRDDVLIGRAGQYVSVDPQSYVDVIDQEGRPIAAVNTATGTLLAMSSGADGNELLDAWKHAGKVDNPHWLYSVAHSSTRALGVVVKAPRRGLLAGWKKLLAGWLSVGVLAGGAAGWFAFRLLSRQLSLASLLERAIRREQLEVHYQPIIRLEDGECIGVEALVRWKLDGKNMSPDVFVPMAEEQGLIQPLTDLVLLKALDELGPLLLERPGFHISINLAAVDLQTDRFLQVLTARLAASGIAARQIHIEATERSFLDADATRQTIAAFRSAGHPVYIDDFGTGYSSLAYLQNSKVDVLKIDKSFIDTIDQQAASSIVAPHIIAMSHALGLEIVAEGVEHAGQADYLKQRGVQYGQGWLFAKAMPAGALIDYLRGNAQPVKPAKTLATAL